MEDKILITGITGFIGSQVTKKLINKYKNVTAIIRPDSNVTRYEKFKNNVEMIPLDLSDTNKLKTFLTQNRFDQIIHIGALRGGRSFNKSTFLRANVNATEQIALACVKKEAKLIFCSSVGVFGAIPIELPANNLTPRKEDNYYHITKIQSEAFIQKQVLSSKLRAVIIRPAITYGPHDYGFPFTLTKLVDKKLLFLPNRKVMIHMTNINILSDVFFQAVQKEFISGQAYNVADSYPVSLQEIADFISNQLRQHPYLTNRKLPKELFQFCENFARSLKNELWTSRFELISKSWFYDVSNTYSDFSLPITKTIPEFKIVTDWYKTQK